MAAEPRAAAGHRRGAARLHRRPDLLNQTDEAKAIFADFPATAALYLDPDGSPRDVGTVIRNPDLARTYARIARKGADALYSGPLAQAIVDTVKHPPLRPGSTRSARPGVMELSDLAAYKALDRDPTHIGYRGLDVYGMAPPSSGGSTVGEILNILEGYPDLGTMPRERALHLYLEASRLAYADRGAFVADPGYVSVPLAQLLSDQFAAQRRAKITETAATSPVPAGDPSAVTDTSASTTRKGSTTNLTVTDRWGNVVDYTFTIEQTGGNGMVVPGYGFLLNNELTDFNLTTSTDPAVPGGVSTGANKVEPGKRPRSSIAPTIVLRNGKPFLALGSPGGASIITTVAQILVNRLDFGMSLPDAIAALRLSQRNSATTQSEPGFEQTPEYAPLVARGQAFAVTTVAAVGPADRRRDGHRVPARRQGAGGGRAHAARRRQRRGGRTWRARPTTATTGATGCTRRTTSSGRARAASSERAAPDEGLAQRDLVGVLEVGADREARGQARHRDVGRALAQGRGDVQRGRLAGRGRVGREDDLADASRCARARRARRSSGPRDRCRRSATARRRGRGSGRGTRACARWG